MFLTILLLFVGLLGLYVGGEWLVKGAARLASSFGASSLVIGLTVVAWSTSAPELVVGVDAALRGTPDIALGNVVGSNIANIGLVLSVMGLLTPLHISKQLLKRDLPIMIVTAVIAVLLALDGVLDRIDGVILFLSFISVSWLLYRWIRREQKTLAVEVEEHAEQEKLTEEHDQPINRWLEAGRLVAGLTFLMVGANLTVGSAVSLARMWGVSEIIIGISLVAVGTSLPELATVITAALRKETEIGIGNVIGSNIANVLAVLGVTAIISPIAVPPTALRFDMPFMVGFSVLLLFFALNQKIHRWKAALLLVGYMGFLILLFLFRL